MTEENVLWKDSPSQWLNLGPFTASALLAAGIAAGGVVSAFPPAFAGLILPLLYAVWKYLTVRTRGFELISERFKITSGVINQLVVLQRKFNHIAQWP